MRIGEEPTRLLGKVQESCRDGSNPPGRKGKPCSAPIHPPLPRLSVTPPLPPLQPTCLYRSSRGCSTILQHTLASRESVDRESGKAVCWVSTTWSCEDGLPWWSQGSMQTVGPGMVRCIGGSANP